MATTLGGTTIPKVVIPTEIANVFVGSQEQMHDGTLTTDLITNKVKWTITCQGLTQTEYNTVIGKLNTTTAQAFSPPNESGSYTVVVRQDTILATAYELNNNETHYDVSAEIEEES